MELDLDHLATRLAATRRGPAGGRVSGVSIDSRTLTPGAAFVALRADRDGHDFVAAAVAGGAAAVVVEREVDVGVPQLIVPDTAGALAEAGRAARERVQGPVIAITGSVGKTTTKDLLGAALTGLGPVGASDRSHNNELGVPLTLLNVPDDAASVVVEMGARGHGHIAALCAVAGPTVGIVTVVGAAHLETFGGLDEVARAKGELVESLPPEGTAVLNLDDRRVAAMADRTQARVLTFGRRGEVRSADVVLDEQLRPVFRLHTPWGDTEVRVGAAGRHQVTNALAAASAALASGAALEEVAAGLDRATVSPWRMEVGRTAGGAVVVNDAYNANPTSMAAALTTLAELPARRRFAVVGLMAELGPEGPDSHREVAELAGRLGVTIIAVGTDDYGVEGVGLTEAAGRLEAAGLGAGDAVLLKGSRVAGLEGLAHSLLEE